MLDNVLVTGIGIAAGLIVAGSMAKSRVLVEAGEVLHAAVTLVICARTLFLGASGHF